MKSKVPAIARKEFFASLSGTSFWIPLAASTLFAACIGSLLRAISPAPAGERASRIVESILLASPVLACAVSCGTFSRKRLDGSLESLLSAPVRDSAVVLGSFAAAFAQCAFGSAAIAALWVVSSRAAGFAPLDTSELLLGCVGLAAIAAAQASWCAGGIFCALLVRNGSGAMALALIASSVSAVVASGDIPEALSESALSRLDLIEFSLGMADTRPLFAFVSATAFFLFASVRLLESRAWLMSRSS